MASIDAVYRDENNENTSSVFPRTNLSAGPLHLRNESQSRVEETTEIMPRQSNHFYLDHNLIGDTSQLFEGTAH